MFAISGDPIVLTTAKVKLLLWEAVCEPKASDTGIDVKSIARLHDRRRAASCDNRCDNRDNHAITVAITGRN